MATVKSGAELRAVTAQKEAQISKNQGGGSTSGQATSPSSGYSSGASSSRSSGTVRSGAELRNITQARQTQLQKASAQGTFNPGNTRDVGMMNYYNANTEEDYNKLNDKLFQADLGRIGNYLTVGVTNYGTTRDYLSEATQKAAKAEDAGMKKYWNDIADALKGQYLQDYTREHGNVSKQLAELEEQMKAIDANIKNSNRSVMSGTIPGMDVLNAHTKLLAEKKANTDAQAPLRQQLTQLQSEAQSIMMTPDIQQAIDNLKQSANPTKMWKLYQALGAKSEGEAAEMRKADQQKVDDFNMSILMDPKFYTNEDVWANTLGGWGAKLAAGYANFESLLARVAGTAKVVHSYEDEQALLRGEEVANAETPEWAPVAQQHGEKVNEWAKTVNDEAQRMISQAKNSASKAGQFGIDLATTAMDVAFDAVTGMGLASMGMRVLGQTALEAQEKGANLNQQILYGAANSAVELLTEKLSDGLGMVYGKGFSSDMVEEAISKLAKTKAGANWLRFLANSAGEGAEEVISDLASPFLNWIIDEQARNEHLYDLDGSEVLYDFLLGAAVGMFGQGGERVSGSYAQKNKEAGITGSGPSGGDVQSRMGGQDGRQGVLGFGNRHENVVNPVVSGMEALGYGTEIGNRDEIYNRATSGQENRRTNEPPPIEEESPLVKGGDAANYGNAPQGAVTGPQSVPASGGINSQAEGTKSVKPSTESTQEVPQSSAEYEVRMKSDAKSVTGKIKAATQSGKLSPERVSHVSWSDFSRIEPGKKLTEKVSAFFKSLGNKVASKALGGKDIIIDDRSIKDDIAHGLGRAKACTFKAVPDVLENGVVIDEQPNWQGRGYDTKIIAGAVDIDGKPAYVGCVVRSIDNGQGQRFYLHEVIDGNGNVIYSFDGMPSETKSGPDTAIKTGIAESDTGTVSEPVNSVPQTEAESNTSTESTIDGTIVAQERSEENGTGQTEAGTASTNQSEQGADRARQSSRPPRSFEPRGTGENEYCSARFASRAPRFTGPNEDINSFLWERTAKNIEDDYGGLIPDESELNKLATKAELDLRTKIEDAFGIPVTFFVAGDKTAFGYAIKDYMGVGVFLQLSSPKSAVTAFHEIGHNQWSLRGMGKSRKTVIANAVKQSGADINEFKEIVLDTLFEYGYDEINDGSVASYDDWMKLSDEDRVTMLGNLPEEERKEVVEFLYEEIGNFIISNDYTRIDSYPSIKAAIPAIRQAYVDAGIFTQEEMDSMLNAIKAYESQTSNIYFDPQTGYGTTTAPADNNLQQDSKQGRTPGVMGQKSQSKARSEMATKGEEAQTRENAQEVDEKYGTGDGTFTSRSNDGRSVTARHRTDTQEKRDAEVKRLLKEDYSWNDDDVVEAEWLMYNMVRSIRDYQLGLTHKMAPDAFSAMTEMYNALALKHTSEKSRMGQGLQAEYAFSDFEKIMNRAAKTFLGFTADGRFVGKSPYAKYAKIYAGMEDAGNRIQKAAEENDAKALAQICKDLSDIRNVKRMFGPLSNFVSGVENKILDRIAQSEHGVEALQTLAYGNLNAICDDVQPYKVLNAVKTIRVMNMLSNMSTILNNIGNNIASGITSTNALAQATSRMAAKPFENLTGQKVLNREAKGWLANKEIRTAETDALNLATLVQLYGINSERGKLELGSDKGLFNPNANAFEQTMSLYKFFIGMGVEATDQIKAAGLEKSMNIGIDESLEKGEITESQAETMRAEARHEVNRLLYKDDNRLSNAVQYIRNSLNNALSWGNDEIGRVGLGDITMAFAKVPANVVKARLLATPEGALLQVAQYAKGVNRAKQMHSEVVARSIMEDGSLSDSQKWAKCKKECSGAVYNRLYKIHQNFAQAISFDECCMRAKINEAKEMSQFEMAQLSRNIGRAATTGGMLVLGSLLRGLGALKDFDQEPDDEIRKMYAQKGYSGLMINFNAIGRPNHEWRDGDTVIGGDWLEVLAMPLTIGACATEAAMNSKDWKTGAYMKELATGGLTKSFETVGDLPGMADALNMYNAITSQFVDNNAKGSKLANSVIEYAANSLPSFVIPNAFSQTAAGIDNTVRDVYTTDNIWQQAWNIMKNKGGLKIRQTIPASLDMWGEERTYGDTPFWGYINKAIVPGSGFRTFKESKYEKEILRLTKEGLSSATPKISVNTSFDVDGETYTMNADEKREFKRNRNLAQANYYKMFLDSEEYKTLTDEQRVAVIRDLKMTSERDAKQQLLNDRGVNAEVTRAKWETELNPDEQIQYLAAKQKASALWDKEDKTVTDYQAMDAYLANDYSKLDSKMQALMDSSYGKLNDMNEARKNGINSQMWQKAYDVYSDYTSEEGKGRVEGSYKDWEAGEMWARIQKETGANEKQMAYFEDSMKLWRNMPVDPDNYHELVDTMDWPRESAAALTKSMSELKPAGDNKTVSYKQRLTAIAKQTGVSEKQKWDAFDAYCPSSYTTIIRKMHQYRDSGSYTYEQALKELGKWMD